MPNWSPAARGGGGGGGDALCPLQHAVISLHQPSQKPWELTVWFTIKYDHFTHLQLFCQEYSFSGAFSGCQVVVFPWIPRGTSEQAAVRPPALRRAWRFLALGNSFGLLAIHLTQAQL